MGCLSVGTILDVAWGDRMTLTTRPAMTDDSGNFISGTVVDEAFVDDIFDQIDDQAHSATNPTIKPKATTDEVVDARGSEASLDARLSVALNDDGTLKTQAGLVSVADVQTLVGARDFVSNGQFDDWPDGGSAAPADWALTGAGATVTRTGPAQGDTFTFGAGKYAVKVLRAAADAALSQDVLDVFGADLADVEAMEGRKVSVGVLVKTSVANQARITLTDGVTSSSSSFHSGDGNPDWLTVTYTVSGSAAGLAIRLEVLNSGGSVYFGGVQGVVADFAPSDWQPFSHEPVATATRRGLVSVDAQTFAGPKTFEVPPTFNPGSAATPDATASGRIHSQYVSVPNVGSSESDLMTYTLPANTLDANGKAVRLTMWGLNKNDAHNKLIRVYFDDPVLTTEDIPMQNMMWTVSITVVRTDATHIRGTGFFFSAPGSGSGVVASSSYVTIIIDSVFDPTAGIVIKMTADATENDDVVQHGMIVEVVG